MHTITYLFKSLGKPLNGRFIYAKSIHGLLFNITAQAGRTESDWLHNHPTPRPFATVPLYTDKGILAGVRIAAITERTANLFIRTGEWFQQTERPCQIGKQTFIITEVQAEPRLSWQQLAMSEPIHEIGLRFLSPTAFKQGPGHLPLPLPRNVFGGPTRIWQAFAPPMMPLPHNWLEWCDQDVFVCQHNIETVTVNIMKQKPFTGFVGDVWFRAKQGEEIYLRAWQALSQLITFCGTGHKATMGMGAVERIGNN